MGKGSISVDGVDLSLVPLSAVREQCFITIPQNSFIIQEASLRFNIDPFETYTDEQIVSCLEATQLWTHLTKNDGSSSEVPPTSERLDRPLPSFSPLTPGQLQLFTVARAVLRTKPRLSSPADHQRKEILLLDEATSSLDPATEKLVQDLVQEHFTDRGHTVIMVSNRTPTTPTQSVRPDIM